MLPTTTAHAATSPSKTRRRPGSFWPGALAGASASSSGTRGENIDYYNGSKGSRRMRVRSLCSASWVDYLLLVCFVTSLAVARSLLSRSNDARLDERLAVAPRVAARRVGPHDSPTAANGTRASDTFGSQNPVSLYGRAALLNNEPGFPQTPPLVLSSSEPKAYLLRHFLSDEECIHLMDLARKELAPSTVVAEGGTSKKSNIRTSAGMFLRKEQDSIVHNIENRIAALSGIPFDNGEGMQILRYDIGQKYDPHYDYFHDTVNPAPKRGGQRIATMLIYLQDTEDGGETTFPNAKKPESFQANEANNPFSEENHGALTDCTKKGIPVKSVKGDAILFFSLKDDYTLDGGSLHGACPVIKGQKWTAVKWMRVAKFDGNFHEPLPMPPLTRRTDSHPCVDEWDECEQWARKGWCERNAEFMTTNSGSRDNKGPACGKSCGLCVDSAAKSTQEM